MNWSNYSPFFAKEEFDCKHTGKNEMQEEFMDKLLQLRIKYDKPMYITSGYRHYTHPVEKAKGHKNGEHTKGMCADIACTSSVDRYILVKLALELGFPRIGISSSFVHLGLGAEGLSNNVIWEYSK